MTEKPTEPSSWALVTIVRRGQVELHLDQSIDEPSRFALTIDAPHVQICLVIPGRATVTALSRFLIQHRNQKCFGDFIVGNVGNMPVRIIKDDEHSDRFFLRAAYADAFFELEIVDPVAGDLVSAAEALASEV